MENPAPVDDAARLWGQFGWLTALAAAMLAHAADRVAPSCAVGLAQIIANEDRCAPGTLGEEFMGGSDQLLCRQVEAEEQCARRARAAPGGDDDTLTPVPTEFYRLTADRA
jgi:hypothetical protein